MWLSRFFKHSFIKNTLILTVSTSVAQFLPIIVYPILSRIYTPAQFGALATFTSIICVLSVISTGKYESAILVAKNDEDAANITTFSILLNCAINILFLFGFLLFEKQINATLKSDLGYWFVVSPLVAAAVGIFNTYNEWCVRKKYYPSLALNKIINSAATTIGKLAFAFTPIKSSGLLMGDFTGKIFTAFCCMFAIVQRDWSIFRVVSVKGMITQAKAFIEFPKYTMPAQLLNTIGFYFPVIILGIYFTSKDIGYFSMTTTIVSLPVSVISLSIKDVFRQKANEIYVKKGAFDDLFKKVFFPLTALSFLATISVVAFLPEMFVFVLGAEWETAGVFAQVMLPLSAVNFVTMAFSGVLIIVNKLKQVFYWQVYYCFISLISIVLGCVLFNDIYYTIVLYCVGKCTAYIYLLVISYYYSKGEVKNA